MKMHVVLWLFLGGLWTTGQVTLGQEFHVANTFTSNMVLQKEPKSAHIWGYGATNAEVTVTIGSERSLSTRTKVDGTWNFFLPPQPMGGPFDLTVTHIPSEGPEETTVLTGVMFGDVWLCAGEMNMHLPMAQMVNATEEYEKALTYQQLRMLQVYPETWPQEREEPEIFKPWRRPNNESVPVFSAVCMMFGQRLADSLGDRPIGLIGVSREDIPIEAWVSPRVTELCGTPEPRGAEPRRFANSGVWNGTIAALTKITIRGVIWGQGEFNALFEYSPELYGCHFKNMVEDLRDTFPDGRVGVPEEGNIAFPFGFIQIGPAYGNNHDSWGQMRWHQTLDHGFAPSEDLKDTFMCSTFDLTNYDPYAGKIVFLDKLTVANRLANAAKNILYNESHLTSGPIATNIKIIGDYVTLTFDMDIYSRGSRGFTYRLDGGEWTEAPLVTFTDREATVQIDPGASELAFGWSTSVCEYSQCAVYSAWENNPAQAWIWKL